MFKIVHSPSDSSEAPDTQAAHKVPSVHSLYRSYHEISKRLHGPSFHVPESSFRRVLAADTELFVFVFEASNMVATAQASLCQTFPHYHVLVNNVVTRDGYDGKGFGRLAMESLAVEAKQRWSTEGGRLRLLLTNSPQKGNSGFYLSLGWFSRGSDSQYPTVVWSKEV